MTTFARAPLPTWQPPQPVRDRVPHHLHAKLARYQMPLALAAAGSLALGAWMLLRRGTASPGEGVEMRTEEVDTIVSAPSSSDAALDAV